VKQGATNSISSIEPMKALRVRELPVGDWMYEMKFDGYFTAVERIRSNDTPVRGLRFSRLPILPSVFEHLFSVA
jgi:hypothetical protein